MTHRSVALTAIPLGLAIAFWSLLFVDSTPMVGVLSITRIAMLVTGLAIALAGVALLFKKH